MKNLMDGPKRSAFAESAARLDSIARPGEQNGGMPLAPAADRLSAVSPDEAWGRRFMSMGIGPDLTGRAPIQPIEQAVLAVQEEIAPAAEPILNRAFAKPEKPGAKPEKPGAKPEKPGPIGLAIGKPVRKSLLARVFSRQ